MWQIQVLFVSTANQSTASNLSDHQLSQVGFVQPERELGRFLCPIESCGRRYAEPKALYKHYRRKSDALHKELAVASGGRSCNFCHEPFKRFYDWERHMRSAHKSSPAITEGLDPSYLSPQSSSISQPTELQLRQGNVKSNLALSDLGSSPRRASLLSDNRFHNCNNLHQPWQSGSDRPVPRLENKD